MADEIPVKIKFISDVADALKGFGVVSGAAAAGLGLATKVALDFNSALNSVSRSANIDYGSAELKEFGSEIKKVAPALGMMPVEFANLAGASAKLGIAKSNLIDFTTVVAEVSQIGDLTGQKVTDLGESFAALQTITGANVDDTRAFGAVINRLDDEVGGSIPGIVEFTRQTAATGKILGITTPELAAYGSTMASLGIANGDAYRSMGALMTKLAAPQTLSSTSVEGLNALGYSVEQMSAIMKRDAEGGIRQFLERIKELSGTDKQKALGAVKQLVGEDYGGEILTLALATGKLDQALKAAGDSSGNLAKYQDELKKKAGSIAGQSAILQANLQSLGISIGSALLPAINSILGAITPVVIKFANFADQHPRIVLIGTAFVGLVAAILPVGMALSAVVATWTTLSGAWVAAAPFVTGTLIPAIAGVATTIVSMLPAIAAVAAAVGVWTYVIREYAANWNDVVLGFQYTVSQLGDLWNQGWEAGAGLLRGFVDGVQSQIGSAIASVSSFTSGIRAYLPFSPSKKGALTDLDKSGGALINTIAQGVTANASRLNSVLNSALDLDVANRPQLAAVGISGGASGGSRSTNNTTGGENITVNFTVNLGGAGGAIGSSIVDQLRPYAEQIGEEIERVLAKKRRGGS